MPERWVKKIHQTYAVRRGRYTFGDLWNFRIINMVQVWNEIILLWCGASASGHMWPTTTLSANHIASVVQWATGITITMMATFVAVWQTVCLWQTLITVFAGDQVLARTFAGVHVATRIIACAQNVTGTQLATFDIVSLQIPVAFFAHVALTTAHMWLAVAEAGLNAALHVADWIADAFVQRAIRIAITCWNMNDMDSHILFDSHNNGDGYLRWQTFGLWMSSFGSR